MNYYPISLFGFASTQFPFTFCYTLEVNYHNGRRTNTLAPKLIKVLNCIEDETPETDLNSKIYSNKASPEFT